MNFQDISLTLPQKLSVNETFSKSRKKQRQQDEKKSDFFNGVSCSLPQVVMQEAHHETTETLNLNNGRLRRRQQSKRLVSQNGQGIKQTRCDYMMKDIEPLETSVQLGIPILRRQNNSARANSKSTSLISQKQPILHTRSPENKDALDDKVVTLPKLERNKISEEERRITVPWKRFVRRSGYNKRYSVITSDEEMLSLEKQMGDMLVTTRKEKSSDLLDISGRLVQSSYVYKERESTLQIASSDALSNCEEILKRNRHHRRFCLAAKSTDSQSADPLSQISLEETRQIQKRFYKTLDIHLTNQYRANHNTRRNAICEEIEKSLISDGASLLWWREHLRIQQVLESYML